MERDRWKKNPKTSKADVIQNVEGVLYHSEREGLKRILSNIFSPFAHHSVLSQEENNRVTSLLEEFIREHSEPESSEPERDYLSDLSPLLERLKVIMAVGLRSGEEREGGPGPSSFCWSLVSQIVYNVMIWETTSDWDVFSGVSKNLLMGLLVMTLSPQKEGESDTSTWRRWAYGGLLMLKLAFDSSLLFGEDLVSLRNLTEFYRDSQGGVDKIRNIIESGRAREKGFSLYLINPRRKRGVFGTILRRPHLFFFNDQRVVNFLEKNVGDLLAEKIDSGFIRGFIDDDNARNVMFKEGRLSEHEMSLLESLPGVINEVLGRTVLFFSDPSSGLIRPDTDVVGQLLP